MGIFKVTLERTITRTVCLPAENEEEAEREALAFGEYQGPAFVRTEPRPFTPVAKDHDSTWTIVEKTKELPRNWRPGSDC
jgi:hypothetical protein